MAGPTEDCPAARLVCSGTVDCCGVVSTLAKPNSTALADPLTIRRPPGVGRGSAQVRHGTSAPFRRHTKLSRTGVDLSARCGTAVMMAVMRPAPGPGGVVT